VYAQALRGLWVLALNLPLLFSPIVHAQQGGQLALPAPDAIAPVVKHDPPKEQSRAGESLTISATVTDNVGVGSVTLFFRVSGQESYQRVDMRRLGSSDVYTATLEAGEVHEPGIEYYIQASDTAGNTLLHGYSFSPLKVGVAAPAAAPAATAAAAAEKPPAGKPALKKSEGPNWLLIGLGVVAVAALAGGGGGGGGGTDTGSVTIAAPEPQ